VQKNAKKAKTPLMWIKGMGVKPREGEKGSGWSKKLRFRSGAAPACFPRKQQERSSGGVDLAAVRGRDAT
jgi:hypothetical protein